MCWDTVNHILWEEDKEVRTICRECMSDDTFIAKQGDGTLKLVCRECWHKEDY